MTTAVDVTAGVAGGVVVALFLIFRELVRLRERVARLEGRRNGNGRR